MGSRTCKKKLEIAELRILVDHNIEKIYKFDPSQKPLEDIGIDLFNFTQQTIDSNALDVKIDLFIHDQARLFWYHKGCPQQEKKVELDDYYNAKRYVMFLIADKLIYSCRTQSQCPLQIIMSNNKLIQYLQSLSVKEFLLTKAYLRYKYRSNANEPEKKSLHVDDYYAAEKYLQGAATGIHNKCKHFSDIQPIIYWDKIISTGWPSSIADIKNAKTRALVRLNIHEYYKYGDIIDFVDNFYEKISHIIENKQIPMVILVQLIQYFYSNKTIVNMFEFFLRCFLVSRLEKESFVKLTAA